MIPAEVTDFSRYIKIIEPSCAEYFMLEKTYITDDNRHWFEPYVGKSYLCRAVDPSFFRTDCDLRLVDSNISFECEYLIVRYKHVDDSGEMPMWINSEYPHHAFTDFCKPEDPNPPYMLYSKSIVGDRNRLMCYTLPGQFDMEFAMLTIVNPYGTAHDQGINLDRVGINYFVYDYQRGI
jgi:hypothetical protein